MKRQLQLPAVLNVLTAASLLLGLASGVMWARSLSADDVWLFAPRCESGWWMHRTLASERGRLVLISRREYFPDPNARLPGYQSTPLDAAALDRSSVVRAAGGDAAEFEFPLQVGQWASTSRMRFLALAWPAFVVFFAAPPALRVWWRWVKSRRKPAFPVLPPQALQ